MQFQWQCHFVTISLDLKVIWKMPLFFARNDLHAMMGFQRISIPILLAWTLVLGGCTQKAGTYESPVVTPEGFSATGAALLPDKWWTSFEDPVLDALIKRALAGNLGLRSTWARLTQAEATARKIGADLYPTLDIDTGVEGSKKRSRASATSAKVWSMDTSSEFSLGLSSSYEIDLWGRVRATADASTLDAQATAEDVRTAALTLSAEVATTWFTLVEEYGQIDLLESQLRTNEQVLELLEFRFRRGQVNATDVLQQQQLVESRRGDLATVRAGAAVLRNALSILLGDAPGMGDIPRVNDLTLLPPLPATGLPADLVRRRPDVRKAHTQLMAADRRLGAAIANRYPKLSLTAGVSSSAEYTRDLFDNWLATLAANLAAPLFDGGERKAEVARTKAVVEEYLNDYGQTVLDALGEVEDALVEESQQRTYLGSLEQQMNISDKVIQRMRDRYLSGSVNYISVLDALLTHQNLERTHLTARRQLIEFRIDLCRALGGGWQMDPPAVTASKE